MSILPAYFIFSCHLPNELRSPWTYFSTNKEYQHRPLKTQQMLDKKDDDKVDSDFLLPQKVWTRN